MALREADAILVEPAPTATDEVRALVEELEAVLSAEYPREQRHGLSLDAIFQPHIRFFLARLDGVAVGCGGVALFPDFAEVKRMYVRDAVRGRGVAQALLARLETAAADAGLSELRLETGDRQIAAMRLYARAGFRRCAAFGDYAAMAPQAIATSVFFEKQLGMPPGQSGATIAKATLIAAEPQLFVADIAASCAFYRKKLGFSVAFTYGDPPFYGQVVRDGARLNLRCVSRPVIDPQFRDSEQWLSASITLDDATSLFLEFQAIGVPFHQTLRIEPWGARTFIVRDPDGNLILFAGRGDAAAA